MKKLIETKTLASSRIPQEDHLSDYLEILKRKKWIIISLFVLVVGAVTMASFLATPQYEATAQILLGGQPTPMNPLGESPERMPELNLYYETQVNLLKSRSIAGSVIEKLHLQDAYATASKLPAFLSFVSEFLPTGKSKSSIKVIPKQSDTQLMQTMEKTSAISATASKNELNPKIIDWYLKHLHIDPVRNTSLVNVSFQGPDPNLITRIVNEHAETAIESTIQEHQSKAMDALNWLKAQINKQKKEVESSQRAIYEFKKQHNTLSLESNQIIFSKDLQDLSGALTGAKSARIIKEATYRQLQKILKTHGNVMQLPEFSNDPVLLNLRNQLVVLISKKIEMATQYGPKHPKMIELNNGIDQLEKEIKTEENRLIHGIKAQLDKAVTIENSITQSLDKQKKIAMALGERAIEYDVLKQQAKSTQDIYDFLLQQSKQLGLSSAISSSNMHIVDKAEIPVKPVSPKILLNVLLAIFISLFTGTGLAFFLEYMDDTVKTPIDVAVKLGLPALGMVPFHKAFQGPNFNNQLIADNNKQRKKQIAPTTYHISNRLPDELRGPNDGVEGRVLVVESVTRNEGKTTVISRVASNLTDTGLRVLLVDCDFQRQSLGKMFNVSNGNGLGKSIDRIMSHHVKSGSLTSYSVDDLFFMISLHKLSGHLIVKSEDQTLIAHFKNGVLIHIQNIDNPENYRIGTMLLNGGFINKNQLDDALCRHQRTGQPLGYILANAGYISREKLRGPLRLQIEEYLQKMFSWKKGQFSFKPCTIEIYESEKIFFEENYMPMINNLGRIESSKFIEKELFKYIISLEKENLYLLPAGKAYKLIGALNQVLMKKIFEKLKHHFDVLLIDTPPLDAASGIESIFSLADGLLLVIKAGHLSIKILNGALNHLPKDKIIGAVLNQAKVDSQPYYY